MSASLRQQSGQWEESDCDRARLREPVPPSQELRAVVLKPHWRRYNRSARHGCSGVRPNECCPEPGRRDVIPDCCVTTPGANARDHQRLLSHGVKAVCANCCADVTHYQSHLAGQLKGIPHRAGSRVRTTYKTRSTARAQRRPVQHHAHHLAPYRVTENRRGHQARGQNHGCGLRPDPHVLSHGHSRPGPSHDVQSPVVLCEHGRRCYRRAAYGGRGQDASYCEDPHKTVCPGCAHAQQLRLPRLPN